MVYIEHENTSDDIHEEIQRKQLNLDEHVNDCYAKAIIEAVELGKDIEFFLSNEKLTPDEYTEYSHELKESIKTFANKCICFSGSIAGEQFP